MYILTAVVNVYRSIFLVPRTSELHLPLIYSFLLAIQRPKVKYMKTNKFYKNDFVLMTNVMWLCVCKQLPLVTQAMGGSFILQGRISIRDILLFSNCILCS